MKKINVYTYDELPKDIQDDIYDEYREEVSMENPWSGENQASWDEFNRLIFSGDIMTDCYSCRLKEPYVYPDGQMLVDLLNYKLSHVEDYPTGYYMDAETFGYARKNLHRIVEEGMTATQFVNDVFDNYLDAIDKDDNFRHSQEYFGIEMTAHARYFTASGKLINDDDFGGIR